MKIQMALSLFSLLLVSEHAFACTDQSAIKQLINVETQKLLSNAPTLKQAWQDKALSIQFKNAKAESGACTASVEIHLPQTDLDEANQHLDQNPAKRILVAAQGYAIPEQATIEAPFSYQIIDGKVSASDPNTAELKALHNNLEYTYQLLAQLRVNVDEHTTNKTAWNQETIKAEVDNCGHSKAYQSQALGFCACRIEEVSKVISTKQMELIHYIETQPFSVATGSLNGFHKLNEKIDAACANQR